MLPRGLRTTTERRLFAAAAIVSVIVWLALLVSIIAVPFVLGAGLVGLAVHRLRMARVFGDGVRVGPRQLADLTRRIESAAHRLGLAKIPTAYVVESPGRGGAFATQIFSRRFIVISAGLLDACQAAAAGSAAADGAVAPDGGPGPLDFVIGHQIGHIAAGHVATRLFLLPARAIPLFGAAFSRACERTADRCGHQVAGDLAISAHALGILAAGAETARRFDADAYADQRRDTGGFWAAVRELNAPRPYLSSRVAALRDWQRPGSAQPVERNPLAYVAAPLFSVAGGGPTAALLITAVVVALAAVLAGPRIKEELGLGGLFPGARGPLHHQRDSDVGPDDLFLPPPSPSPSPPP